MRSVDEAMDLVSRQPLCDWKGLKSNVQFPSYYRFLQMSRLPRKLVTYFTVERLESGCYICAAFLRAHRIARRQLHDFLGNIWYVLSFKLPLVSLGYKTRKKDLSKKLHMRFTCVMTRVHQTGGNRSGLTGYWSNRSGPVPVWAGTKPAQIQNSNLNSKKWKIPKNTSRCDESNGVKFSQKFVYLV